MMCPNLHVLLQLWPTPCLSHPVKVKEVQARCVVSIHTLRASISQERLSSLALLHIHYDRPIDLDLAVDIYSRLHPRRLELYSLIKPLESEIKQLCTLDRRTVAVFCLAVCLLKELCMLNRRTVAVFCLVVCLLKELCTLDRRTVAVFCLVVCLLKELCMLDRHTVAVFCLAVCLFVWFFCCCFYLQTCTFTGDKKRPKKCLGGTRMHKRPKPHTC